MTWDSSTFCLQGQFRYCSYRKRNTETKPLILIASKTMESIHSKVRRIQIKTRIVLICTHNMIIAYFSCTPNLSCCTERLCLLFCYHHRRVRYYLLLVFIIIRWHSHYNICKTQNLPFLQYCPRLEVVNNTTYCIRVKDRSKTRLLRFNL